MQKERSPGRSRFRRAAALILTLTGLAAAVPAVAAAAPINDNFSSATSYPQPGGDVIGSNIDATEQTGEPDHGTSTVWWKWTAPETGRYRLDNCATLPTLSTAIGVYTGATVSSLTEVALNYNGGGCDNSSGMESLVFDAVVGTTYRFSIGSFGTESSNIRLKLRRTPVNDNYGFALEFPQAPATVVGANADASRQAGEPETGYRTLWWRWTAPNSGRYRLDDCETIPELSTVLGVYTGPNAATLVEHAYNYNSGGCSGSGMEALVFDAVAGTTYRFSVGSASDVPSSNLRLSLRRTPINDNFATASTFEPFPGTVGGTNVEATREAGEPSHGERTIWWKWTAPASDRYALDNCQTDPGFNTVLAVYTGSAVSSLQKIPSAGKCGESSGGTTAAFFDAVAGTTYYFSVGTTSSTSNSNIRLRLQRGVDADSPGENPGAAPPVTPSEPTQQCIDATNALTAATTAVKRAKARTAKARAAVKRAKRALARTRGRKARARARRRVAAAKKKLRTARTRQRRAETALAGARTTQRSQCA